jgi:hypothetical protein
LIQRTWTRWRILLTSPSLHLGISFVGASRSALTWSVRLDTSACRKDRTKAERDWKDVVGTNLCLLVLLVMSLEIRREHVLYTAKRTSSGLETELFETYKQEHEK